MRELDLTASYVQAFAHVSDGKVICSSFGHSPDPTQLGEVDYVSRRGAKVRIKEEFALTPAIRFTVVERDGYAAILNKDLAIDATTKESDASLAVFNPIHHTLISQRGQIKPEWLLASDKTGKHTFRDQAFVVAVASSQRYELGAVAALPIAYVNQRATKLAILLIPFGAIGGIVIAVAILYLIQQQQGLPSAIKAALKRKEFFLEYQPIVELQTERWVGAEILLRWRRANGELIRPDLFISVAEDCGLIHRITAYVIREFAVEGANFFARHPDFHIGINFSATDLESSNMLGSLDWLAQQTRARDGNLVVEATERGFLKTVKAKENMGEMRQRGIQIAIDDFGTGYSSLSYLSTFELDYLKIDKSFVDTLNTDAATSHVVHHIIEMAKSLKLQMVAEGVETRTQANYLREHGVQFGQGWLFAKSMSLADLEIGIARSVAMARPDTLAQDKGTKSTQAAS